MSSGAENCRNSRQTVPYDDYPDDRGFRYLAAFVYSVAIAVFYVPALLTRHMIRLIRELGTESWSRADGTITSGDVKVIHGWLVDYALGQLDYCYKIRGEYYSGHLTRQYPDEQTAWDFVDGRRGKPVLIRYKDHDPEKSILRESEQMAFPTEQIVPGLSAQIWQHWHDELRGEPHDDVVDDPTLDDDEVNMKNERTTTE